MKLLCSRCVARQVLAWLRWDHATSLWECPWCHARTTAEWVHDNMHRTRQ